MHKWRESSFDINPATNSHKLIPLVGDEKFVVFLGGRKSFSKRSSLVLTTFRKLLVGAHKNLFAVQNSVIKGHTKSFWKVLFNRLYISVFAEQSKKLGFFQSYTDRTNFKLKQINFAFSLHKKCRIECKIQWIYNRALETIPANNVYWVVQAGGSEQKC